MSVVAPQTHGIAQEYERLRRPVLDGLAARLRGQGILYDARDLEDFYNEAWQTLYLKHAAGETVDSVEGFVAQVAYYRAIDDIRRRHPDRIADGAEVEAAPIDPDLDARLDDEADLSRLLEGMRAGLSVRERQAAVLCYLQGLSRPEAAAILGLPEKRMQKLMDGVSRKLAPILEAIRRGRWCEEQDSLIQAYAMGLLDPAGERYALAVGHLDGCSACRRRVLGMRGIAALVPPTLMPWHLFGAGAATAGGAAATTGGAGATAATGGGLGAVGTAAAAVAAAAVIAAAAIGLTRGDDTPKRPVKAPVAAVTPAPAVATSAPQQPKPTAKAKAKKRAAKPKRRKTRAAATAAPTASPAPAVTTAPTAAPTAAATATTAPTAAPPADAGQEFGLQP